MLSTKRIGFMQGRLSPMVGEMIQSFPWTNWKNEFGIANKIGLSLMEWTLDQKNLRLNPVMNQTCHAEILFLCSKNNVSIPSLTGDCFMQFPFWKMTGKEQKKYQSDFIDIIHNCSILNIKKVLIPLVDNGSIENKNHEENLTKFLNAQSKLIKKLGLNIMFESDYSPYDLKNFINKFDSKCFGINYDTGNSASLGFDPIDEIKCYGSRIVNVHIKDRVLKGNTVPLGDGNTQFDKIFRELNNIKYDGNFILQTARSTDDVGSMKIYYKFLKDKIKKYEQ